MNDPFTQRLVEVLDSAARASGDVEDGAALRLATRLGIGRFIRFRTGERAEGSAPNGERILVGLEQGFVKEAAEDLVPIVYDELHRIADRFMRGQAASHTLQPTALVHEAYIRIVGSSGENPGWNSRWHFFGAAAEAMRRILVENARRKQSLKQGGQYQRREADLDGLSQPETAAEVLAVDESLGKLTRENSSVAKLVELRYFAGLTLEEAASASGISVRTAHRYWTYAKAWLHNEISARNID